MQYKIVDRNYGSVFSSGIYFNRYHPGTTVKALDKTLGIMVFKTLVNARDFKDFCGEMYRILEVEGIGEAIEPKLISCGYRDSMNIFYREMNSKSFNGKFRVRTALAPIGTVCYKEIRVLREYIPLARKLERI